MTLIAGATDGEARLGLGIVSFAHMHAHSYARAVRALQGRGSGAELVGVADDDPQRALAASRAYSTRLYPSVEALLASDDVDAVIVCSENVHHSKHVLAAARAGKHVLCEKPIATSVPHALAMIRECESRGVLLATAFPVRHAPPVARAKELIDAGRIGRVLAVAATNHGRMPGGWFVDRSLSGGGAVLDHTVHVADLLRWFLGDEVARVYAEVDTRMHAVDIDDCGTLMLEFRGGAFATLDPSWSRPRAYPTWGDVTMQIVGSAGMISLDVFAQSYTEVSDARGAVLHRHWGDDMDLLLVDDFVRAVREARPAAASGVDGMKALEVALAAYESARLRKPVELPLC